jgi:hypothetical protein
LLVTKIWSFWRPNYQNIVTTHKTFPIMRILSLLALISAPIAAVSQQRLGEKREEVSPHAVHHQVGVSSGCTDNESFLDLFKDGCDWYTEKKDLRCPYADLFAKNGLSANEECCACGGGIPDDDPTPAPGMYYIKSPSFSKYISFSSKTRVGLSYQNSKSLVQLVATGSGTFSLKSGYWSGSRYIDISSSSGAVVVAQYGTFQLIPAYGGTYNIKHEKSGRFLSGNYNGVLESTYNENTPYIEFEFIPSNAENLEELNNEMTDV